MTFARRVGFGAAVLFLLAWASGELRGGTTVGGEPAPPAKPGTGAAPPKGPLADNSRCFVCHANYDFNDEQLVAVHTKANIGCVRCHGDSPRHSTDEDGLTPPERMFPKSLIRFNCLGCHDWVKLVANDKTRQDRADLKEKPDHQAVLDGTVKDKKLCTDCHGDHRLGHRTRLWDKRTGRLLFRDGTPGMVGNPASGP